MALTDKEFSAHMQVWTEVNERLADMGLSEALWEDMKDFFDWSPANTADHIAALRRE
jgi:hypothetical protein